MTTAKVLDRDHVFKTMRTPIGPLKLVASEAGLSAVLWEGDPPERVRRHIVGESIEHSMLVEAERQLGEYFAGERRVFALPLDFGGTEFQNTVWHALLTIPFGQTRSYGEIAMQVGNPRAVRAVGAANGRNPISIITPCHRVVGSNGKLVGFAGGLETKARLLAHEAGAHAWPRA